MLSRRLSTRIRRRLGRSWKTLKDQLQDLKEKAKGKGKIGKGKGKQQKEDKAVKNIQAEIDAITLTMVKGLLNEKTVDLLQVYYGNAIRGHSNDCLLYTSPSPRDS